MSLKYMEKSSKWLFLIEEVIDLLQRIAKHYQKCLLGDAVISYCFINRYIKKWFLNEEFEMNQSNPFLYESVIKRWINESK